MHPNTFLRTFWRAELRPEVFVAMSLAREYQDRYRLVIDPAVRVVSVGETKLAPNRVDITNSGDSILSMIADGIAHAQVVLADVSSVGKDSITGCPYRNANVMYEVGIALACRQPSEVILVRDDHDPFLFDVSTIPHLTLDFTDVERARVRLADELVARINERVLLEDARVRIAGASLTAMEISLMKNMAAHSQSYVWGLRENLATRPAFARLLDKNLIKLVGQFDIEGYAAYQPTSIGYAVAQRVSSALPKLTAQAKAEDNTPDSDQPGTG